MPARRSPSIKKVYEACAFCYAKQRNVPTAKAAPEGAGDIWTWIGLDAQSKLAVSWYVGGRDSDAAIIFMDDLAKRLANRVQLTSDGHRAYLEAVEGAFGSDIDYGPAPEGQRRYSPAECIGAAKHRVSRSRAHFDQLRRTAKSEYQDGKPSHENQGIKSNSRSFRIFSKRAVDPEGIKMKLLI